jgi:hypothetical protein
MRVLRGETRIGLGAQPPSPIFLGRELGRDLDLGGEAAGEIRLQKDAHRSAAPKRLKLPRFRGVVLDLGDYGSVVTASIAAS